MKLSDLVTEYKVMIEIGDSIAVITRFYDDEIVQVENNEAPVQGKNKLLELEKASIEGVYSFNLLISSIIIDENQQKVMGEMSVKFNSKKAGKKKFAEAFVQQWKNEKIIYQRFYYGAVEVDD
ncbi:MAG: hypothetical protein ABIR15_13030 [Chitinophagaceae bacterium]